MAADEGGAAGAGQDAYTGTTFAIEQEDHTLANSLRFFLNKKCGRARGGHSRATAEPRPPTSARAARAAALHAACADPRAASPPSPAARSPNVAFCGYSMPHPTEHVVNLRVQTTGGRARRQGRPAPHALAVRGARERRLPWAEPAAACSRRTQPPARLPHAGQTARRAVRPPSTFNCPTPDGRSAPGAVTAAAAVRDACAELQRTVEAIDSAFVKAVEEFKAANPAPMEA